MARPTPPEEGGLTGVDVGCRRGLAAHGPADRPHGHEQGFWLDHPLDWDAGRSWRSALSRSPAVQPAVVDSHPDIELLGVRHEAGSSLASHPAPDHPIATPAAPSRWARQVWSDAEARRWATRARSARGWPTWRTDRAEHVAPHDGGADAVVNAGATGASVATLTLAQVRGARALGCPPQSVEHIRSVGAR